MTTYLFGYARGMGYVSRIFTSKIQIIPVEEII